MKYHTLLTRETKFDHWAVEFGAYDRDDVEAERDAYNDEHAVPMKTKIITTSDRQADIDQRVAAVNQLTVWVRK